VELQLLKVCLRVFLCALREYFLVLRKAYLPTTAYLCRCRGLRAQTKPHLPNTQTCIRSLVYSNSPHPRHDRYYPTETCYCLDSLQT
jgi:hypothetical protein